MGSPFGLAPNDNNAPADPGITQSTTVAPARSQAALAGEADAAVRLRGAAPMAEFLVSIVTGKTYSPRRAAGLNFPILS